MQAGLSWKAVLDKRENFRKAFRGFDPVAVSRFAERDIRRLMADAGIIRNRQKILAAVHNARRFLEIQREFGTFDRYMWRFVDGKPVRNCLRSLSEMPARTALSANRATFRPLETSILMYSHEPPEE